MNNRLALSLLTLLQRHVNVVVPLALAFLASGCNTMDISRVSTPPAISHRAQTGDQNGLKITADPFLDKAKMKDYFGTAGGPSEIAIVYLRVVNGSTNAAWIVQKANTRLSPETGTGGSAGATEVKYRSQAGEAAAMTGALLISFPLLIGGNLAATAATVVQHNFALREWRDGTIYPGASREGFLYFKINKKETTHRYSLTIEALSVESQTTNTVVLPVTYENL